MIDCAGAMYIEDRRGIALRANNTQHGNANCVLMFYII